MMFTNNRDISVSSLGEKALIARICGNYASQLSLYPEGPGDDCAVIDSKNFEGKILSTCDAVILDRHFSAEMSAYLVGKKAMNRNVSDIASMGGMPLYAMTSAILSPKLSLSWLDEFCAGLQDAAKKWNIKFIGGDLARGGDYAFSMHISLLGRALHPLLRKGAKSGDSIFVTGPLGASFESGKHLNFTPRINEGLFLSSRQEVSACTDLSDGLASDIQNLLSGNLIAEIEKEKVLLADFPNNSFEKALTDGEDYELLFTANASGDFLSAYEKAFGQRPISLGQIKTAPQIYGSAVFVNDGKNITPLNLEGYSHFSA